MRMRHLVLASSVAMACFVLPAHAQTALSGQISSAEEGMMEGVVVTAKKDGSTISISVISDAQGRYAFPADRLEPGHYSLKARAATYELDGARTADVAAGSEGKSDIKLRKVKNLAPTLTNAEWMISMPGTDQQKKFLLNCNSCHTIERILKSSYDVEGFLQIFQRMSTYYPGSHPLKPQPLSGNAERAVGRGPDV